MEAEYREKILKEYDAIIGECIQLTSVLRPDIKKEEQVFILSLYCSLIELSGSLSIAVRHDQRASVAPILRSFLEVYINFLNIIKDSDYLHYFRWEGAYDLLKAYREAAKTAPFDKKLLNSMDKLEKVTGAYDAKKFQKRKVFTKFRDVGKVDLYRWLYDELSAEMQGDYSAVKARHINRTGTTDGLIIFHGIPCEKFLQYITYSAVMLFDATRRSHHYFATSQENAILELDAKIINLKNDADRMLREASATS